MGIAGREGGEHLGWMTDVKIEASKRAAGVSMLCWHDIAVVIASGGPGKVIW